MWLLLVSLMANGTVIITLNKNNAVSMKHLTIMNHGQLAGELIFGQSVDQCANPTSRGP